MHLNIILLDFFFSSLKIIEIVEGIKALHLNCNGMIHSWKGKAVWRDSLCPKSVWPTDSSLGICLAPGSACPRVSWVCSQWGGDVLTSRELPASSLGASVPFTHPASWTGCTSHVLLAQKPQHLGMENPWCAVSQLCQCPAQPLDLGNTGWIVPVLERAVAWSHLPALRQIIASLRGNEH